MRFVTAQLLSLALCPPTTANSKGGHGAASHASPSHVTHIATALKSAHPR